MIVSKIIKIVGIAGSRPIQENDGEVIDLTEEENLTPPNPESQGRKTVDSWSVGH